MSRCTEPDSAEQDSTEQHASTCASYYIGLVADVLAKDNDYTFSFNKYLSPDLFQWLNKNYDGINGIPKIRSVIVCE